MQPDDVYERWRKARSRAEVPADFADGVMQAVHAHEARWRSWLVRQFFALTASRAGRAGLLTVAVLVFALRLSAVLSVFVANFARPLE